MTFIGKLLAADPHGVGPRAKRTMAGSLVAVVLLAAPGGVATADSVRGTQGQIAALQQEVDAGAARIHSLTEAYQEANLRAATLAQQVATDDATLRAMRARVGRNESALRQQALLSYTGQQGAGSYANLGGSSDPAVRAEYLMVASGDVGDSVDQLKVDQDQVATQARTVSQEQAADAQAARAAGTARTQALTLAADEQGRLTQLQSELTGQIAAEQAASARAVAAHRAALAVASAPATGAPVNNGLVAAVQSVVASPTPAPHETSPRPSPTPPAPTPPVVSGGGGNAGGNWLRLRECESGDNYQENTGNGYYGAYQFDQQTWTGLGYGGRPDQNAPATQDAAAMKLQARSGWGQWPACAATLGLT